MKGWIISVVFLIGFVPPILGQKDIGMDVLVCDFQAIALANKGISEIKVDHSPFTISIYNTKGENTILKGNMGDSVIKKVRDNDFFIMFLEETANSGVNLITYFKKDGSIIFTKQYFSTLLDSPMGSLMVGKCR